MTTIATEQHPDEQRWALLMRRAQAGGEAEYRSLLNELSTVIERYLRSRIGHHHFIEDCVQESLIAMHRARHTWDPTRPFRPWLFAIVRHKAVDALRQMRSQRWAQERHWEAALLAGEDPAPDPVARDHDSGRLMEKLSVADREALRLTRIEGLSTAEAAAQLRISEGALKVRTHRAIGRLARLLETDTP